MKNLQLLLISGLMLFSLIKLNAQNDSIQSIDLLNEISASDSDTMALFPDKIIITQRMLWGEHGLMRNFDRFELTPENRENELNIRRVMLVSHQIAGYITLGEMVAQGFIGAKLYNDPTNMKLKDTHETMAALVNIGFFTTASLSLFAPPKMLNERKGYSSIKLHKALQITSLASMIATNILASQLESNPDLKPYHRAAAYTAFGTFAAGMIVIKF